MNWLNLRSVCFDWWRWKCTQTGLNSAVLYFCLSVRIIKWRVGSLLGFSCYYDCYMKRIGLKSKDCNVGSASNWIKQRSALFFFAKRVKICNWIFWLVTSKVSQTELNRAVLYFSRFMWIIKRKFGSLMIWAYYDRYMKKN